MYRKYCSDFETEILIEETTEDSDIYLKFDPHKKEITLDIDAYPRVWNNKSESIDIKYCPFCGKKL